MQSMFLVSGAQAIILTINNFMYMYSVIHACSSFFFPSFSFQCRVLYFL